jgi:Zn-dependent protease
LRRRIQCRMESVIQTIAIYAIPLIFAITLHEAAHGYVARMLGDNTAYAAGRVTLNPLKHIDPVGTLLVPAMILLTSKLLGFGGLLFGWAKPVPVDFGRLNKPKRDMAFVAAAGPGINLVMAIIWALSLKLMIATDTTEQFFMAMAVAGVQVNLMLMALNLLPIPPLDGGRIVFSLLPDRLAYQYAKIEPYGMVILIVLLVTNLLTFLVSPILGVGDAIVRLFL